jgi:quercetin dioxygenase-like cupin family protein
MIRSFASACLLAIAVIFSCASVSNAAEQSATPVPPEPTVVQGAVVGDQPLGDGNALWTVRLRFPSGAELPYWTTLHPALIYVEQGAIGFTVVAGRAKIIPNRVTNQVVISRIGSESILFPGASISLSAGVEHSFRTYSVDPAMLLITTIAPDDAPPYAGAVTAEGYSVVYGDASELTSGTSE